MIHSRDPRTVKARSAPLLLSIALMLLTGCGDASPDDTSTAPLVAGESSMAPANGTLHLVWLARLQGFGEGVPCDPDDIPALPAAARITAELEAQGDMAVLACIGDTLIQPASISSAPAAIAATIARSNVDLDAMAAAGVDIYVPGASDMIVGLDNLLDRAGERGVPIVISNVQVQGRDDIKPYVVVEHKGMRFAILGVVPKQGLLKDQQGLEEQAGVTFTNPGRAVRELSRAIINGGEANAIVCLSALTVEANQNLCKIPNLHFMVGSSDSTVERDEVVHLAGTTMFLQPISGRSVGQTTFRVVDDDWQFADISPRHVLPAQLEREREALAGYIESFGTDDIEELASLVIPYNPETFILKCELMDENEEWLVEADNWQGSYLDHRSAAIEPVPDDDPVKTILATHGAAIRASVADLDLVLEPLPEERTIPHPEDCRTCHQQQFEHWEATSHASAYGLLVDEARESDSACVVCHTAGFGLLGGYRDPRHEAPFGSITCLHCHEVQGPHAYNKRLVVDPLYVTADAATMNCKTCHNADRSPGFERQAALDAIACPPMRGDDPALLSARADALVAIQKMRERGNATDWESYLEGRTLVGMGRPAEGLPLIRAYMKGRTDWPQMTYATAVYLEKHDDAPGSLELFREYLATQPGDLQMNIAYIRLLANSDDPSVQDAEHALSHARLVAPPDANDLTSVLMPAYLIQVDMLMDMGRAPEAHYLLQRLKERFVENEDVDGALRKYGLITD